MSMNLSNPQWYEQERTALKDWTRGAMAPARRVEMAAMSMLPFMPGVPDELVAYHGTGGKWPSEPAYPKGRFRLDKIANTTTGEGTQMEGFGAYFAKRPATSTMYRSAFARGIRDKYLSVPTPSGKTFTYENVIGLVFGERLNRIAEAFDISPEAAHQVDDLLHNARVLGLDEFSRDLDKRIHIFGDTPIGKSLKKLAPQLKKATVRKVGPAKGALYQMGIPVDPETELLNWWKPLKEQSSILKKLQPLKERLRIATRGEVDLDAPGTTGQDVFKALENIAIEQKYNSGTGLLLPELGLNPEIHPTARGLPSTPEGVSVLLDDLGIKGAEYKSFGKSNALEPNYVIWNQDLLNKSQAFRGKAPPPPPARLQDVPSPIKRAPLDTRIRAIQDEIAKVQSEYNALRQSGLSPGDLWAERRAGLLEGLQSGPPGRMIPPTGVK